MSLFFIFRPPPTTKRFKRRLCKMRSGSEREEKRWITVGAETTGTTGIGIDTGTTDKTTETERIIETGEN